MKSVIYTHICVYRMVNLTKFSRAREVQEPAHNFFCIQRSGFNSLKHTASAVCNRRTRKPFGNFKGILLITLNAF